MTAQLDAVAAQRPRLFGLAYRMLGSAAQAEDAVQEAFVRWYAQPRAEVRNEAAFLTTVVTNLCLDQLRAQRGVRAQYPGPWLPEPIALAPDADWDDDDVPDERQKPADAELEHLQSISLAFLALLESLTPLERAVYLLVEVFDHSHAEAGAIVRRSEAACRQIYRRARRALGSRSHPPASPRRHRELLDAFLVACQRGDLDALTTLLADDVVARSDGGGNATAAKRPVVGARAVARLYRGLWRNAAAGGEVRRHDVNGWPALLLLRDQELGAVIQIHASGACIDAILAVVNPAKLSPLAQALGLRVAEPTRRD